MTAIVGILCSDGVVIGTDSSTTFAVAGGVTSIEQPTEKIEIIGEGIILAGTGAVGLNQRFTEVIKRALADKKFKGDRNNLSKYLCRLMIEDFQYTGVQPGRHGYGALVAFSCEQKAQLCEFPITDFQPEFKTEKLWYVSMGSSQFITDSFLGFVRDVYWNDGMPTVNDGIFAITWTLRQAIDLNTGGVKDPIRIAVLEKQGTDYKARLIEDAELQEHVQNIEAAKNALRNFRTEQVDPAEAEELPVPPN